MEEIIEKIKAAKNSRDALNDLTLEYLPFLKKEILRNDSTGLGYDEKLSIAMLVFVNCVKQYDNDRGNFISFLSYSIRYRLIDQMRTQNRKPKIIYLHDNFNEDSTDGDEDDPIENQASMQKYRKDEEEKLLKEEIESYNEELAKHSLSFGTLAKNCPRQKRSRELCITIASTIVNDSGMREKYEKTGLLPQSEAALKSCVSVKTIEKYRRYLVALMILMLGDYPAITGFIKLKTK